MLILLLILSPLLGVATGLLIGLRLSSLYEDILRLKRAVVGLQQRKVDVTVKPAEDSTFIADPENLAQRIAYEKKVAREELNK